MLGGSDALSASVRSARRRGYIVLLGTALLVFIADHLTKWLVTQHLAPSGELFRSSPVTISYVQNRGAAFGLFPQFQWLYLLVAVVVGLYIVLIGPRYGTGVFRQVILGMILGGAVANGVDRLTQGYVVDFINLHWWPVFNLADSSIVLGIIIAVLTFGFRRQVSE